MDKNRLFLSKLDDALYSSYSNDSIAFGFLNESEAAVAHEYLDNLFVKHCFWGGYDGADRVMLYFTDDVLVNTAFTPIALYTASDNALTHRDYLGSLMGLGIKRDFIGDIISTDFGAVIFAKNEIVNYLILNLNSVGRYKASAELFNGNINDFGRKFEDITVIVTSLRLDNIVSSISKCSRKQAVELIESDKVFINHYKALKASKLIKENDTLSIRGIGKFKIKNVVKFTKSGRLVLSVVQYK